MTNSLTKAEWVSVSIYVVCVILLFIALVRFFNGARVEDAEYFKMRKGKP